MGLETNARKALRCELHFETWGAEVDGDGGWVGPPWWKLVALALLTAGVCSAGIGHEALLECLFRRPLFAVAQSLYTEGSDPPGDRHAPFQLSADARDDMALLSIVGLTCVQHSRGGEFRGVLHGCLPFGEGACAASAGRRLAGEQASVRETRTPNLSTFAGSGGVACGRQRRQRQ